MKRSDILRLVASSKVATREETVPGTVSCSEALMCNQKWGFLQPR